MSSNGKWWLIWLVVTFFVMLALLPFVHDLLGALATAPMLSLLIVAAARAAIEIGRED